MNGHWSGAQEETLQAELAVRGADESDQVVGMAETARCLAMLERDLGRADAMLMEAKAVAARHTVSHPALAAADGILRYHAGELDAAEGLLLEARTLCKRAGDRIGEYQANEYLAMIRIEQGDFRQARERCRTLVELGERLREGSEAPFARALEGVCRYALGESDAELDQALEELRVADAKHRLAYVLNRAAGVDLAAEAPERALDRAQEALANAEVLDRRTEALMARVVLAQASAMLGDAPRREVELAAIDALLEAPVASWARRRAATLRPVAASG
jgi:tetratricopeptide (TPR) repeat protein